MTRKPRPFKYCGDEVASAVEFFGGDRRIDLMGAWYTMPPATVLRLSRWLLRAAAWAKEGKR